MGNDEESNDLEFLDDREFTAKFMLDPDIPEEVKGQFSHLDKNLGITNLRYERNGIDEPEEFRTIARAMHVLNNKKYYDEVIEQEFTGDYREVVRDDGAIVLVPIFKQKQVSVPKFPKTFHAVRSSIYAFVNSSASRMGHRIKAATTVTRRKEESFEDKSSVSPRWGNSKNN